MAEFKENQRNYIRRKNEVKKINTEKNKIWDRKYTEINTYIRERQSIEACKFVNNREKGNNVNSDNIT